jgi:hypothetical protein
MTKQSSPVKPGQELQFAKRLKAAGQWPPYTPLRASQSTEHKLGEEPPHPATPFLFVPAWPGDVGQRPVPAFKGTAWISSPAILLLNEQDATFEIAPRLGVKYRIFVMIGNTGNAPVVNGFAEFFLDSPPLERFGGSGYRYTKTPLLPRVRLGTTPFPIGSRSWSWALSPPWTPTKDWDMAACVIAQVFDPINDGPPGGLKSWDERKVGVRVLAQNIAGTWEGDEKSENGAVVSRIHVKLTQNWTLHEVPGGVLAIEWAMQPTVPSWVDSGLSSYLTVSQYMLSDATYEIVDDKTGESRIVHFGSAPSNTLYMRAQKRDTQVSHALLSLIAPGASPPIPDIALLKLLPQQVSSTWSARRKADAELVFQALAAWGIAG